MRPDRPLGRVRLVGAGPGAADLLTVRALRAVESAQALLYDALVADEVAALAPAACLKIRTGKRAGRASMRQETINHLMLRLARRGLEVVRLKGGDPSIFGRVGEEAAFLRSHGVDVEIVPGVTAACAAAAQFGIPLTHRREARRLLMCTARLDGGASEEAWAAGANAETTLAIYMGRDQIASVAERLIQAGRDRATPAVAVENAGGDNARLIAGTLGELPQQMARAQLSGPVLVIVGEVASDARVPSFASAPRQTSLTAAPSAVSVAV